MCTEPSDVAAGGHDFPVRSRRMGCGRFRTDVSYLPDLESYVAELLSSRERFLHALDAALRSGQDITVSRIAHAARVDRTFRHRPCDLLERVHAAAAAPAESGRTAIASRASLRACPRSWA
ncbi:hypothetical protein JCM4814A_80870 [Streptomyces phaeofaciens JCM 4814]|uniref:Uncharacterized protein n=1 Tax=Streptomyces phaeofaciens TaxID=68254 RepID=A0A918M0N5_9ACTN|nr:hypothetical protein [Streptomyces phaeofaciens]GGT95497.1 hypothetical protein GCM10010226_86490 [Streptomyces phaeofaciens]